MKSYVVGDVLKHKTKTRYLRVLGPLHWITHAIEVRNVDEGGFELDAHSRQLTVRHLNSNYELHYRP